MGLLDKAKAAAQEAATKAREGVDEVQTKRELGSTYEELGKKTYDLLEQGTIEHAELTPLAERITGLKTKLAENGSAPTGSTSPPPSDAPPAMPT